MSPALSGIFLSQGSNASKRGSTKVQQPRGREEIIRTVGPSSTQRSPQGQATRRVSGCPSSPKLPQSPVSRRQSRGAPQSPAVTRRASRPYPVVCSRKEELTPRQPGSPFDFGPALAAASDRCGGSSPGSDVSTVDTDTKSGSPTPSVFDFGPILRASSTAGSSIACSEDSSKIDEDAKAEAAKTLLAIDSALRAVQVALNEVNSDDQCRRGRRSPSMSPPMTPLTPCDSDFSSTASTRACSKDSRGAGKRASSLQSARMSHKERVHAQQRSARFTRGVLAKLDEMRTDLTPVCA